MNKKCLIVEDHEPSSTAVVMYLKTFFPTWAISTAFTEEEALKKLPEERPDVVILDIALPDGDGLDIVRQFAKPNSVWKPKFVVVTALGDKAYKGPKPGRPWLDQLEPSERALVTAFFVKPFIWGDFLSALAKAADVPVPDGAANL